MAIEFTLIYSTPTQQYDSNRTTRWGTPQSLETRAVDYARPYPILTTYFTVLISFSHIFPFLLNVISKLIDFLCNNVVQYVATSCVCNVMHNGMFLWFTVAHSIHLKRVQMVCIFLSILSLGALNFVEKR